MYTGLYVKYPLLYVKYPLLYVKYPLLYVKYLLLLSDCNEIWIFATDFRKRLKYEI